MEQAEESIREQLGERFGPDAVDAVYLMLNLMLIAAKATVERLESGQFQCNATFEDVEGRLKRAGLPPEDAEYIVEMATTLAVMRRIDEHLWMCA